MTMEIRPAGRPDVPSLVELMQAFYAEADFPLASASAANTFEALLGDPRLGGVWVATDGTDVIGHVVLTVSFSMEYGGLRGFIDDFYVRPAARGRGAGACLLGAVREAAAARGVRALLVETSADNETAVRAYARAGYADSGHMLMSLALAPAVHHGG